MKKRIKILISLLLICTIMLPFKVKAETQYGSSISIATVPSGGGGNGNSGTLTGYGYNSFGVRLTLLNSDGTHVNGTKSVNIMSKNKTSDLGTKAIYVVNNNTDRYNTRNKTALEWKLCGASFEPIGNSGTWEYNQTKDTKCGSYNYYVASGNFDGAANAIVSSISNYNFSSLSNAFNSNVLNSLSNLKNFVNKVFGVTYNENDSSSRYWFILVEPIVIIDMSGQNWAVGTVTEFDKSIGNLQSWSGGGLPNYNTQYMNYPYIYFENDTTSDSNIRFMPGNKKLTIVHSVSEIDLTKPTSNLLNEFDSKGAGLIWLGGYAKSTKKCSEFANDTNIWSGVWVYDSSKANNEVEADAKNDKVRQSCGRNVCSEDTYNKNNQLNNVKTTGNNTVNCCNQYPDKEQTRIYRDHPECYSCIYDPKKINATCEEGKNTSSVGDSFKSTNGYVLDNQTCVYKIASGGVKNASKNLVTRRRVSSSDSVCKVVCTENVEVKFPLLSSSLYRKGSYIEWPINVKFNEINSNSMLNNSRLTLNGSTKCWYYVNRVEFYKMTREAANTALKKCITDVYETFTGSKKIINYNLSGEFSVNYNDPDYGKSELSLSETSSNDPKIEARSSEGTTLSKLKEWKNSSNVYNLFDDFVKIAEGITYTVTQSKDYSLDYKKGYMASYQGKYYTYSDFKGKVSSWSTNSYIDIGKGVLPLANKKYNNGIVSLNYKNIGGGSLKYSNTTNTYSGTTKNNACSYKTIENDVISCECPSDTKNAGEILDLKMITESLTCNEAIEKYCNSNPNNPDDPSNMTVCPEDSPIEKRNRPVEKSCLNDNACKKLTCYNITCKKSDGNYVYLNLDIQKEMDKDSKLTYEQAYKKTYEKNGCGGKPKYNEPGNIEYRVIDLKDPFPGNAAKAGSSFFNTNIKGRKPGSNWNSTTIVQKEILNNRGVKGDEVYNLTPLYEFNLTPSVIKKIREYNDNHSYDDFTLSCKGNNKQACVATDSGFNFKKNYGVVAINSNCSSINDLASFNRCYNS